MTSSPAAAPPTPDRRTLAWAAAAGLLLAVLVAAWPLVMDGRYYVGDDFVVYHAAGSALFDGRSPYDFSLDGSFMYIYTPFAAIPLAPLALLGTTAALAVWTLISVLAMQALIWISLRLAGVTSPGRRAVLTLVLTVAALPLGPVVQNFWLGQINLVLVFLIVADLARRSDRFRGVGIGIAAGIKLTPLIFVVHLLLTGQYRAARTALLTFLATVLVGFVVLPGASAKYWGGTFIDTSRMYPTGADVSWNHSLRGLIAPLSGAGTGAVVLWFVLAAVVGVAGLAVARAATLRGNALAGIVACGVTGVLVSPLSWAPHWVWCVPLLVLAVTAASTVSGAVTRAALVWVAFFSSTFYWVASILAGRPIWPDVPTKVFAVITVAAGLAVLAVLARPARRDHEVAVG